MKFSYNNFHNDENSDFDIDSSDSSQCGEFMTWQSEVPPSESENSTFFQMVMMEKTTILVCLIGIVQKKVKK